MQRTPALLAQLYRRHYDAPEAEKTAIEMLSALRRELIWRLRAGGSDSGGHIGGWMSNRTRAAALDVVSRMEYRVGGPRAAGWSGIVAHASEWAANSLRIGRALVRARLRALRRVVGPDGWANVSPLSAKPIYATQVLD